MEFKVFDEVRCVCKLASKDIRNMDKHNTSNLSIRTPEKRYRKHLPASDNVDMATNVSQEFVAASKGMKKGFKHKKKYETIIKTDQEKSMARQ